MRSLTLLSTAVVLGGLRPALGQESHWVNGLGGSWNLETNWQSGEIPDSFVETAIIAAPGSYTIDFDRSTMLRRLRVLNPEARVNMSAGDSLYMSTHVATMSGVELTINGLLTVNTTGENRLTEISICDFDSYDDRGVRAEGTGTIRLNAHPSDLQSAQIVGFCSVVGLHVGPDQTIAGTGRIHARIWNDGAIVADVPGRALDLSTNTYYGLSHEGELRAENGGILRLTSTIRSERNPERGRIVVADADSAIEFTSAYLSDLLIENNGGGRCDWGSSCQLTSVQLVGTHQVDSGTQLSLVTTLINDGTLTVGSDNADAATLNLYSGSVSIDGTGTIHLAGMFELPTLARISGGGGSEVRFQSGQTLSGSGQIETGVENYGTVSPGGTGNPIGLFELQSTDFEQRSGGRLVIDVGGTGVGEFDRITRVDDLTLRGALIVRLANGFVPNPQDEFSIMTYSSRTGAFDSVQGESGSGLRWRARYESNAIVLTAACATDIDLDGETGLTDLAILLSNFGRGGFGILGDVDGNNSVTLNDLAILLRTFGGPCV